LVLSEIQNTQELARVTELLYDRLTVQRELIEWRSDLLLFESPHADEGYPLWRGDLVEIDGLGEYRIVSFGGEFIREATGVIVRRFTYVGEKV
jgi:hypothetical protein